MIADASNQEIDRLNARAQHLRAERGELGHQEIALPNVHYGLRDGDLIAFNAQHRLRGQPRVENGTRGQITRVPENGVTVTLDGSGRRVQLASEHLDSLRLAYAQHVYRQQGATVERSIVLTGGWQTSKETAYVRPRAPDTAPTGTSPATSSATTDKTPTESNDSPRTWATAADRHHHSTTERPPTSAGNPAETPYDCDTYCGPATGSPDSPPAIRPTAASDADADQEPRSRHHQYR